MTHRLSWSGALVGMAVIAGLVGAGAWWLLTRLPAYTMNADYTATMTQADRAAIFGSDAIFATIGLVLGFVVGWSTWMWFRRLGWPVAPLAVGAGIVAGIVAASVGELLGPGPLAPRLAVAKPGDVVPVALALHAPASVALWGFAASLGPLVGAWLSALLALAPQRGAVAQVLLDEDDLDEDDRHDRDAELARVGDRSRAIVDQSRAIGAKDASSSAASASGSTST